MEVFMYISLSIYSLALIYCISCILNLYNRVKELEKKLNSDCKCKGKHMKLFEGEK